MKRIKLLRLSLLFVLMPSFYTIQSAAPWQTLKTKAHTLAQKVMQIKAVQKTWSLYCAFDAATGSTYIPYTDIMRQSPLLVTTFGITAVTLVGILCLQSQSPTQEDNS